MSTKVETNIDGVPTVITLTDQDDDIIVVEAVATHASGVQIKARQHLSATKLRLAVEPGPLLNEATALVINTVRAALKEAFQ